MVQFLNSITQVSYNFKHKRALHITTGEFIIIMITKRFYFNLLRETHCGLHYPISKTYRYMYCT